MTDHPFQPGVEVAIGYVEGKMVRTRVTRVMKNGNFKVERRDEQWRPRPPSPQFKGDRWTASRVGLWQEEIIELVTPDLLDREAKYEREIAIKDALARLSRTTKESWTAEDADTLIRLADKIAPRTTRP